MSPFRRVVFLLAALLTFALPAKATWSIVIVDLATGEVAVGIATCLTFIDLRPSTIVVVPGYGVAAAQSFLGPLPLRQLIRQELLAGTPANQILAMLAAADPGHQTRQYGIVGAVHGSATFTGTGAGTWAGGLTGQTGTLVYAIQGNVLTGQPVITAAETALVGTPGTIGDKLMAAMQAARSMGGDGRCSCTPGAPAACGSPPPSFNKSAHVGLMIVSRPSDLDAPCGGGLGCAGGDYWMDLNVANQPPGAPDPVVQLQALYNTWKSQQVGRPDHFQSSVTMSGTNLRANGIDSVSGTVWLRDAQGNPLGNTLPVTVGLSSRSTVSNVVFGPVIPQANGSYTFTMQGDFEAGEAILDVAVDDGLGRVGIWPQPMVMLTDVFGSCGTGAIGDGNGGILDALRIGGSAGNDRVVSIGLGQPFVLTIDPPAGVATSFPVGVFALWAHLGIPHPASALPLGPGAGALCFTPYPIDPTAPTLLLADSAGLGGYLAATPAPWTLGFPGMPALLDVAIQGAMVVDPQGTVAATNAVLLRTTPLPTPTITAIQPEVATSGTNVTVWGNDFLVGTELTVGGNPTPLTSWSPTVLTFTMPAGHGCDTAIAVRNLGTPSATRVMNATPTIGLNLFTSGPATGGATWLLTGENLGQSTVTFGGAPLQVITQSNNAIFGTTPPGTPGQVPVVISNALGCQVTTTYTYL